MIPVVLLAAMPDARGDDGLDERRGDGGGGGIEGGDGLAHVEDVEVEKTTQMDLPPRLDPCRAEDDDHPGLLNRQSLTL